LPTTVVLLQSQLLLFRASRVSQATMKATLSSTLVASMAGSALAFAPASSGSKATVSSNAMPERMWDSMVDKTERSKACPWLPRPAALDGTMAGDFGFDPFYLSSIPKNFAGFIQPPSWESTEGLPTVYWMREAELKHCRLVRLHKPVPRNLVYTTMSN
jgi:hypothetical protein